MTHSRIVAGLAASMLMAGCSSLFPTPTAPAAGDLTSRDVVVGRAGFVTMLPASPLGAQVGTEYTFTMPMCGTLGPIDVDGSFWDARMGGDGLDGQAGLFRLVTQASAVFTAADGKSVSLTRHSGAKEFRVCS